MKTYLVPIDFSEAAFNAADFAARLSNQTDVTDIILLNAFYISPYEIMLPDSNMVMLREEEIDEEAVNRINQLDLLKRELMRQAREGVKIHTRLNRSHLLRAVVDVVNEQNVDLVLMGSVGNSTVREGSIGLGDHVIKVSKASPAPVMVIPPNYQYETIAEAVIACDFKKVRERIPLDGLNKLLGNQSIKLLVVNIDKEGKHAAAEQALEAEKSALYVMLKAFEPSYHYINDTNIITGILNFANERKAQLVIALPHTYSFLQSILHNSISQQLAKSATVPVLLLK
jgi:nucleotide-binding universal stress UspA family protein